jgi:hypothetical protein
MLNTTSLSNFYQFLSSFCEATDLFESNIKPEKTKEKEKDEKGRK